MHSPNQTPPRSPCLALQAHGAQPFPQPHHMIRQEPDEPRVLLVPSCLLQPCHRATVVLSAHVALGAVLVSDIPQPDGHDKARERHADRPIRVHAVAVVLVRHGKVDEAAFALGPDSGLARAGLVCAEGLGEDDIDEPAGVEGLEGADDEDFDDVAKGAGV